MQVTSLLPSCLSSPITGDTKPFIKDSTFIELPRFVFRCIGLWFFLFYFLFWGKIMHKKVIQLCFRIKINLMAFSNSMLHEAQIKTNKTTRRYETLPPPLHLFMKKTTPQGAKSQPVYEGNEEEGGRSVTCRGEKTQPATGHHRPALVSLSTASCLDTGGGYVRRRHFLLWSAVFPSIFPCLRP